MPKGCTYISRDSYGYPRNHRPNKLEYVTFTQNIIIFAIPKKMQTLIFILPKDCTKQLYKGIFWHSLTTLDHFCGFPRLCLVLQELWLLVSEVTLNDIIYRLNDDIISHLNILLILLSCYFGSIYLFKSFLASGEFKLSSFDIFANSLDPDQVRQNDRLDLDPNCLTPWWYS